MLLAVQRIILGNRWLWTVICIVVSMAFWGPSPAEAYTAQQILQPYEDDIKLCINANNAYNLATMRRRGEFREQVAQLVGERDRGLGPNEIRLREEHARRSKVDQIMRSGYGQLIYQPHLPPSQPKKAHVPHFGWLDHKSVNQRHSQYLTQVRKEQQTAWRKEMPFWVVTLGHITRKALQARIVAKQKESADFANVVRRGDFKIYFPGIGWTSNPQIRARAAANEKKITEIRGQIQRGEYKVFLPHLGWVTRNMVLARIKTVDTAIRDTNNRFRSKQAKVFRHYLGWTDQKTLEASIQKVTKRMLDLDRSISQGTFKAHLAGLGWTSGKALDAQMLQIKKNMDQVKGLLGSGRYKVPVPGFGHMDRNQIHQALRQKGLTKKQIAALQRGLVHIGAAGRVDLDVRGANLAKLRRFRGNIGAHAAPLKQALSYEKSRRQRYNQEAFTNDKNDILRRLQRQRAFLQQSLALIPWKLPPLPPKKPLQLKLSM